MAKRGREQDEGSDARVIKKARELSALYGSDKKIILQVSEHHREGLSKCPPPSLPLCIDISSGGFRVCTPPPPPMTLQMLFPFDRVCESTKVNTSEKTIMITAPQQPDDVNTTLRLGRSGDLIINQEPEVKFTSLAIKLPGRPDIVLPIPESGKPKGIWFGLKEGSIYTFQFNFQVSNNTVSGLRYTNTVRKSSVIVSNSSVLFGNFSPSAEPCTYAMPVRTAPSGAYAREPYFATTKFLDDNNKCYMEINYNFVIRKDYAPLST